MGIPDHRFIDRLRKIERRLDFRIGVLGRDELVPAWARVHRKRQAAISRAFYAARCAQHVPY